MRPRGSSFQERGPRGRDATGLRPHGLSRPPCRCFSSGVSGLRATRGSSFPSVAVRQDAVTGQ